ncbi:S-methyl-5'-thioadenosine phosphorylase [Nesterenkonia marinintestina]|uniref:S-methyl-5'-thioadenosine phosphorylase n=1 Tax=Nesterenkonia marinintestina TaxID=2979865 RepID=UPI0021C0B262|nr:S-methyl-5'-thioadenosine phosphorylase [Nesterenkonia sp. GX14115]
MTSTPEVAVIGGSGFYTFLRDPQEFDLETPYGRPSAPIAVGTLTSGGDSRTVAFLPRHGRGHEHPAHRVNHRANLWALRSLGVRQVLAPCAVGGLHDGLGPGSFVVPDQLVDRTTGREKTYYDAGACHISFADPYCPRLRTALLEGLAEGRTPPVDGGTMVVIDGPRFSTRAESRWYARQGWDLVNMTGMPEASLARELELCYAAVALVTDLDAGISSGQGVDQAEVFRVFSEHTEDLKRSLSAVVLSLTDERSCSCAEALAGMSLPLELP